MLTEMSARLQDPSGLWFILYLILAVFALVALGVFLHHIADRMKERVHARVLAREPLSLWRKLWLSIVMLGFAVAPYIALLAIGGIVFTILGLGPMLAGLGALLITTFLFYRCLRVVALALFNPDQPKARLLPLRDSAARFGWGWARSLSLLAAVYLLVTRTLLTIGAPVAIFQLGHGLLLLVWAIVLTVLVLQLARKQAASATSAPADKGRHRWNRITATPRRIWPMIALAYLWCATLVILLSAQKTPARIASASLQTALIITTGLALLGIGEYLRDQVAKLNNRLGRYIPGLEVRTLRYLRALWWGIRILLIVASISFTLHVWGVDVYWFLTSPLGTSLLAKLLTLLVTAAVVMVVVDLSTFISERLIQPTPDGVEASKKRKTLVPLLTTVMKSAALFIGALVTLHLVGLDVTPILAGVGIFSLAIGFGAQTLVKDIINGLFIIVEDSIAVGDVVTIRGTGGAVEAVNLRTIRLRDLQGSVHIIPNSQIDMITNMTKDYAYYVLDVNVAYREDIDAVVAALQEIDAEMRADPAFSSDMLTPIDILGVESFTDSAVLIRARLKTKPIKQWSVGREFNRRMRKLFDARGIAIPFPTRRIYTEEVKRGEGPSRQPTSRIQKALASPSGEDESPPAKRHDE
jgi:small-conductance mechanosensitive channel